MQKKKDFEIEQTFLSTLNFTSCTIDDEILQFFNADRFFS